MRLLAFSLLPVLVLAGSLLPARQENRVTVTAVTGEGDACPPGSIVAVLAPDNRSVSATFTSFKADFQQGLIPPGERDLDCTVVFHLNFPIGCTLVVLDADLHGVIQITEGGVTGNVEPSYVLSTGNLDRVNASTTVFDSKSDKDFVRNDAPLAKVTIRNANEQNIRFESHTRLRVITVNSDVVGVVYMDSMGLSFKDDQSCW